MGVPLTELTDFLSQPAPREIPTGISRAARRTGYVRLFVICALILFLVTPLFAPILFPMHILQTIQLDRAEPTISIGTITRSKYVGVFDSLKTYETDFTFTPAQGALLRNTCYVRGEPCVVGQTVEVEYLPASPKVARITGASLDLVGWSGTLLLLVPVFGALLLWLGIRAYRRRTRLLRVGRFAAGEITAVYANGIYIKEKPQYVVALQFQIPSGREITASYKTADTFEIALANAKYETGEIAGVLYNPENPDHLLITDMLLDIAALNDLFEENIESHNASQELTTAERIRVVLANSPGLFDIK